MTPQHTVAERMAAAWNARDIPIFLGFLTEDVERDGPAMPQPRHFVWRQARTALIRPETRDVVLASEILGGLAHTIVDSVESELRLGVESTFQVDCETFCVEADHSTVSW